MDMEVKKAKSKLAVYGHVGQVQGESAKSLWRCMNGRNGSKVQDHIPYDEDDFGRCYRLSLQFPEWTSAELQTKLAQTTINPEWRAIALHWDELVQMYLSISPEEKHVDAWRWCMEHSKSKHKIGEQIDYAWYEVELERAVKQNTIGTVTSKQFYEALTRIRQASRGERAGEESTLDNVGD